MLELHKLYGLKSADIVTERTKGRKDMDKNKRSRKAAFLSYRRISCVFALILALAISLSACGGPSAGTAPDKAPIYAKIDQSGTAYLPLMDGNVITIKGDVCRAVVLEDRSTILVLERDGLLYSTTVANTGEKTTIAEDVTVIEYTATSGVYYFEDVEENIGSTYSDMGTLKCATVGSEPVKIATDIIVAAPVDGTDSEYVNPAGFTIAKYVSAEEVDGTNQLIVNWMFFDGTEAKIFARDVYNSISALSTTISK